MICRYGRPLVWFTICPSQNVNPLVLKLGNIDESLFSTIEDRVKFCMNDPVACTEFFHLSIRGVLEILEVEVGMNQFYAVVEAQMRGTLHLHLLGWNTEHTLSTEEDWIKFADKVSCAWVNNEISLSDEEINQALSQWPMEVNSFEEIKENAATLAMSTSTNLHDYRHRKSCFKSTNGCKSGKCRYNFPRELCELTHMDNDGITIRRNHAYINTFNELIMNLFRCNHDIRILPNLPNDDLLALLYYLTNYTTKMESSNYSVCDVAATARRELLQELQDPTARQFADRLFMRILVKITGKNEISSNLVVNELLKYPEEYCSQSFKTLNYGLFLRALAGEEFDVQIRIPKTPLQSIAEENLEEDYVVDQIIVTNLYEDYTHRGSSLHHLSLYHYVSRMYKKKLDWRGPSRAAHRFSMGHPQYETHVQMLLDEQSAKVPKLVGPATNKFTENEYVQLLQILFKPWKDINEIRTSSIESVEDFLEKGSIDSDTNLEIVHNFLLLQKSKLAADRRRIEKENLEQNGQDGELLIHKGSVSEDLSDDEDDNDKSESEIVEMENEMATVFEFTGNQVSDAVADNTLKNLCKLYLFIYLHVFIYLLITD